MHMEFPSKWQGNYIKTHCGYWWFLVRSDLSPFPLPAHCHPLCSLLLWPLLSFWNWFLVSAFSFGYLNLVTSLCLIFVILLPKYSDFEIDSLWGQTSKIFSSAPCTETMDKKLPVLPSLECRGVGLISVFIFSPLKCAGHTHQHGQRSCVI